MPDDVCTHSTVFNRYNVRMVVLESLLALPQLGVKKTSPGINTQCVFDDSDVAKQVADVMTYVYRM